MNGNSSKARVACKKYVRVCQVVRAKQLFVRTSEQRRLVHLRSHQKMVGKRRRMFALLSSDEDDEAAFGGVFYFGVLFSLHWA